MKRLRFSNEFWQMIREIGLTALAILTPVGTLIGFWFWFETVGVVGVLAFFLILTFIWSYRKRTRGTAIILEAEEAQAKATELLRAAKYLCYCGGVGFISEYTPWKKAYQEKLGDPDITIHRFLNAISPEVLEGILRRSGKIDEKYIHADKRQYLEWLRTHSEHLRSSVASNCFYHFEGAPIWKYGFHCIIFDKKHVAIPFLSSPTTRKAVFIRDCPEIAAALAESLGWAKSFLNLEEKTSDGLLALARSSKRSVKKE